MPSLVEKLKPLFSLSGRASRLEYWRVQLALIVLGAATMSLVVIATRIGGWLGAVPCLLFAPILAAGVCVAVRRLHDRGKAAWWVLTFAVAPYALLGLAGLAYEDGADVAMLIGLALSLAATAISIWAWIELGFLRGAKGQNRYGAAPPPHQAWPPPKSEAS